MHDVLANDWTVVLSSVLDIGWFSCRDVCQLLNTAAGKGLWAIFPDLLRNLLHA